MNAKYATCNNFMFYTTFALPSKAEAWLGRGDWQSAFVDISLFVKYGNQTFIKLNKFLIT